MRTDFTFFLDSNNPKEKMHKQAILGNESLNSLVSRNQINTSPESNLNYFKVFTKLQKELHIQHDFQKLRNEKIEQIRSKA